MSHHGVGMRIYPPTLALGASYTHEQLVARLEAVRKRCETIVFEESASGAEGCPALRALQRIAAMRMDEVLDEEEVKRMSVNNRAGIPQLPPNLTADLQAAQQKQQRAVMEAVALLEHPMIMVNTANVQALGPYGVKVVLGEVGEVPGLPMKSRGAFCLPWPLVRTLAESMRKMDAEANPQLPVAAA